MEDALKLLEEKIKNNAEKIAQEREENQKREKRIDKIEEKLSSVERYMGSNLNEFNIKFAQLEIQFQSTNEKLDLISNQVTESNKKVENKIEALDSKLQQAINTPKKDTFKDWVFNLGMKLVEAGVLFAIGKALIDNMK